MLQFYLKNAPTQSVANEIHMARPNIDIDWTGCELVERIPGKVSGQPIVRGTRILPAPVVSSFDRGASIDETREDWPSLSAEQIQGLVAFAHAQRGQLVS